MSGVLQRLDSSLVRKSVVTGVVLALLLAVAGVAYAVSQPRAWTAESVLVVLPAANLDDATSATYYETLSRGQIVATFAEIAGNLRFEQQAATRLDATPAQRATITTEVTVVPDTAVILFRVTAEDAGLAERMADTSTSLATEYLAGLSKPYRTQVVHAAAGSAYVSSTSRSLLLAAALVVAMVAGLAVQQAVYHLGAVLRPQAGNVDEKTAPRPRHSEPRPWPTAATPTSADGSAMISRPVGGTVRR